MIVHLHRFELRTSDWSTIKKFVKSIDITHCSDTNPNPNPNHITQTETGNRSPPLPPHLLTTVYGWHGSFRPMAPEPCGIACACTPSPCPPHPYGGLGKASATVILGAVKKDAHVKADILLAHRQLASPRLLAAVCQTLPRRPGLPPSAGPSCAAACVHASQQQATCLAASRGLCLLTRRGLGLMSPSRQPAASYAYRRCMRSSHWDGMPHLPLQKCLHLQSKVVRE
jgi:hypothetical protein